MRTLRDAYHNDFESLYGSILDISDALHPLPPYKLVLYTTLTPFATVDDTIWYQGI